MILRKDVERIIKQEQARLDDLAECWNEFTRHMECGEVRTLKESCRDSETIIECLKEYLDNDWRPYPDAIPATGKICLVTIEHKGGWLTREVAMFLFGYWLWKGRKRKVIAWKPIQEPYRGDKNEHGSSN